MEQLGNLNSAKNARILIVEDEIIIAEGLKIELQKMGYVVVDICSTYNDAIRSISSFLPDLIMLDITLGNKKEGIEIAKIVDEQYHIPFVFLSSHKDIQTLDSAKNTRPKGYLVKPIDSASIMSTIEIALYTSKSENSNTDELQQNYFIAKDGIATFKMLYSKIKWIRSDRQYMEIYGEGKKRIVRMSIVELLEKLPKNIFCQVHKSYIVNIHHIKEFSAQKIVVDDASIPIGRKYKNSLKEIGFSV